MGQKTFHQGSSLSGNPRKIAVVRDSKHSPGIQHFPALGLTQGSKGKRQVPGPWTVTFGGAGNTHPHVSQHRALASVTEGRAEGDGNPDRPVVMGRQEPKEMP